MKQIHHLKLCVNWDVQSEFEEGAEVHLDDWSLESQFRGIADLEIQLFRVEVVGGQLGVSCVVRGRQDVGDPLIRHIPVLPLDEVIEAGVSLVLVNGVRDNVIHLVVSSCVGVVVIIVNFELFMRILDQSESVAFDTANANIYGAGSSCFLQTFNRFLNGWSKLDDISEGIGPGFANSGLVLLHRLLNPVWLPNSCIFAKTCDAANKASPNQIDKRLGTFGSEVVEHKEGVLVDGIAFVPVQGSQVK